MNSSIIEIVVAAIGGFITAITYWIRKQTLTLNKSPKNTLTAEAFAARRGLHMVLESLMLRLTLHTPEEINPTRILAIHAHNGGGIPRPAVPLYVTITDEEVLPNLPSIREEWVKRPVDTAYVVELLMPLINDGKILVNKLDLTKYSLLSDAMEVQEDTYAYVWLIGIDDKLGETWYISVHFNAANEELVQSPVVREHMRWAVSESQKFLKLPAFHKLENR